MVFRGTWTNRKTIYARSKKVGQNPLPLYFMLNAAVFVLGVAVYLQGYLDKLLENDDYFLSRGMMILIAFAVLWTSGAFLRIGSELKKIERSDPAFPRNVVPGWMAEYLDAIAKDGIVGQNSVQPQLNKCLNSLTGTLTFFRHNFPRFGIIGTVIGFVVALFGLKTGSSIDPEQASAVMIQFTRGISTALFTTLIGMVGALWMYYLIRLMDVYTDAFRMYADGLRPGALKLFLQRRQEAIEKAEALKKEKDST